MISVNHLNGFFFWSIIIHFCVQMLPYIMRVRSWVSPRLTSSFIKQSRTRAETNCSSIARAYSELSKPEMR